VPGGCAVEAHYERRLANQDVWFVQNDRQQLAIYIIPREQQRVDVQLMAMVFV
jgi:hypothetical protein